MSTASPAAARDPRGRFQPGWSGNPAGKKPGTLNHATQLKRLLGEAEYDRVARTVIDAACDGHMSSARFLMERLVPKARGRAIALDLPPGASRTARLSALVDQMCAGEISADEAKAMIAVIDAADRAAGQPAAAAPVAVTVAAPAPPPSEAASALQTSCISDAANPPGLRAQLLQTTCISRPPGAPWRDPAGLTAAAAAIATRVTVAALPARRPASSAAVRGAAEREAIAA